MLDDDDVITVADVEAGYEEFYRAFLCGFSLQNWERRKSTQDMFVHLSEMEQAIVRIAYEACGDDDLIEDKILHDNNYEILEADRIDPDTILSAWRKKHPRDRNSPKSDLFG